MLLLAGVNDLNVSLDRRWSVARIALQTQAISLVLMLISAIRDWASFDPSRPATWIYVVGCGLLLAGIIGLHLWMPTQEAVPA